MANQNNSQIKAVFMVLTICCYLAAGTNPVICSIPQSDTKQSVKQQTANKTKNGSGEGWKYLAQKAPGNSSEIFAPGLVNFGISTRDIAISPDGKELYFRVNLSGFSKSVILFSQYKNGKWSKPEVAPFSTDIRWKNMEPAISPDGEEFFFSTDRPLIEGSDKPNDAVIIWKMKKIRGGWGKPEPLNKGIDTRYGTFYASITNDGTLYYCSDGKDGNGEIWRAKKGKDGYATPELLPKQVNCGQARYNPFIAPDESYLIQCVMGLKDSFGGLDLYINFRNSDDTWSEPVNLGPVINSKFHELCAYITRDGRYFFYGSSKIEEPKLLNGKLTLKELVKIANTNGVNGNTSTYWIDAGFIKELKQKYYDNRAKEQK